MPTYTQTNQPIEILTPLGKDVLLITSFSGEEGLSQPFHFHVTMVADAKKEIAFDKILGQKVTIRLTQQSGKHRFINGVCNRFSQGDGDADLTTYHLEMVPQIELLKKRTNSRIFQQKTVPDILKKMMEGLDIVNQIEGTFQPRNYCVQYRESDFNFVSRLMEEEGIYYFFTHTVDGHKMVLANSPTSHPDMPLNNKLSFERNVANSWIDDRVLTWEKQQELVTGQHTFAGHKFEMHGKRLDAKKTVVDSIQVGKATHKLKAGGGDSHEQYHYPSAIAQRFDGIDPGGGVQAAELNKILKDNDRVIEIRSQQEAVQGIRIDATTSCRNLYCGHKFTLQKHGSGDGDYVVTSIVHKASKPIDYKSNAAADYRYANEIKVIPFALPYRPQRETPKPFVQGTQTAIVVGPAGEEIFCDKYGRVKVQFHWDREGKYDAKSSCWVRVSTLWAGKAWGIVNVPRIGHEVIVGFEEGDPDLPIIIGSVFNADHMPPDELPKNKMVSGLKSSSTPGGAGYNGMVFNDTKGKEGVTVHAQYNMDTTVENNQTTTVHNNRTDTVDVDDSETVGSNQKIAIGSNQDVKVGANQDVKIGANQTLTVSANQTIGVSADHKLTVGGAQKVTVSAARTIDVSADDKLTVGGALTIGATGAVKITSAASITLEVGGSSIKISPGGIDIISGSPITVTGAVVKVNS